MQSKNSLSTSLMWSMLGVITSLPQQTMAAVETGYAQAFDSDGSWVKITYDAAVVIFGNYFFVPNNPGMPKNVWCGLTNFTNATPANVRFNSEPSLRWKVADDQNDPMTLYEQNGKTFAHAYCVGTFFANSKPTLDNYETTLTNCENKASHYKTGVDVLAPLFTLLSLGVIVTAAYKTGALGKILGGCKRLEYDDLDETQDPSNGLTNYPANL